MPPQAGESPSYEATYSAWHEHRQSWWRMAAAAIDWSVPPTRMFDPSIGPFGAWFPDGRLNTCHNCLDRHVAAGAGARTALIWDSPVSGQLRHFTYAELRDRVAKFAGGLASLGVGHGDRVVIYMPMVPEAAIAMLACARLGAIHSVVFGGVAAPELAARIEDAQPRLIVSASCGIEPGRLVAYKPLLDHALALSAHQPASCVILQRPMLAAEMTAGRDHDFAALEAASAPVPCVDVPATDPLYILYTSGTTGKPKGIVRDNGGHAVALRNSISMIYGLKPGEVMWTASDVGWVVGHSYIVYAPLLAGLTSVMYEGKPVGTPDAGAFWRVIAQHKVRVLFTAPTALRAIKQQDPAGSHIAEHDISSLDALFLAGERCDPPTATWIADLLGTPVIDHWWQTETGWAITANFRGLGLVPNKPGSGGRPCPGHDLQVLDDHGAIQPAGTQGHLSIRLPLPPGCAPTLWNNDAGYSRAYLEDFPGWYRTGDGGMIDAEGDVWVMGRTDDIINVAGHRLSTGSMEEVLAGHADIAECAVIGVHDEIKGQAPLGLVVLKSGVTRSHDLIVKELITLMRDSIGPVAALRQVCIVTRLPKTRSGKILRASLRRLADGQAPNPPATIEDPRVLEEIADLLSRR